MGIAEEEAFMQSRNGMSFQVSDVIQDAEAACRWLGKGARARPASRARCGEAQLGYSH